MSETIKTNVLFADDDRELASQLKTHFSDSPTINLLVAETVEQAHEIICQNHLHVALVDLYFHETSTSTREASHIFSDLLLLRPSCVRVLVTKRPLDATDEIFQRLSPYERSIDCLARKDDDELRHLIDSLAKSSFVNEFEINGLDDMLASVRPKLARYRDNQRSAQQEWRQEPTAEATVGELHSLISKILRRPGVQSDNDSLTRLDLKELGRGKSTSAVFQGRPETRQGHKGLLCIFKIGPRREIDAETASFERFVRFYRGTFRRVEILGSMLGDALGCVCYSFAGPSPSGEGVLSLQDLIHAGDFAGVRDVLSGELNPEQKEWFSRVTTSDKTLVKHFQERYRVETGITRQIEGYLNELVVAGNGSGVPGSAVVRLPDGPCWRVPIPGTSAPIDIPLPTPKDIAFLNQQNAKFRNFRSCITHGDMNGENLLVSRRPDGTAGERVILIDYRDTGRGPIFVDFAALEASFRLSETDLKRAEREHSELALAATFTEECELLDLPWAPALSEVRAKIDNLDGSVMWRSGSQLTAMLGRLNFEPGLPADVASAMVRTEYLATCFMYCLRLLGIRRLSDPHTKQARVRLIAWLGALVVAIRREATEPPANA